MAIGVSCADNECDKDALVVLAERNLGVVGQEAFPKRDGAPLEGSVVGFGTRNEGVLDWLSPEFADCLR